jgi:hypothetical protein
MYFVFGGVVLLTMWALQIRFGDSSDLDPNSIMVRLFARKLQAPSDFQTEDSTATFEGRVLDRILDRRSRETSAQIIEALKIVTSNYDEVLTKMLDQRRKGQTSRMEAVSRSLAHIEKELSDKASPREEVESEFEKMDIATERFVN